MIHCTLRIFAVLFAGLALTVASAHQSRAAIILTEVIPNVTTTSERGDVVELYNTGPGAQDLTDWVLTDLDGDPIGGVLQDPTFAPGSIAVAPLQPGQFAVIDFVEDTGTASWHPTNYGLRIVAPLSPGSFLGSERDELLLADDSHNPIDFVAWADTGSAVGTDGREDLSAMTGAVFDYGLTPGEAAWDGDETITTDADYYASAVDFSAFASVSTWGGGAIRRVSTDGVFDIGAPDGSAQWEAVDRHRATLGNASDDVSTVDGFQPIRVTDDLAAWLGQIETTTFPDRRLARFADQNPADFVPANAMDKTDWQALLATAMSGAWEASFAQAIPLGYEVVEVLDTVSGETFHVLRERFVPGEPGFTGRGTFAFFDGTGVQDSLVIGIPHPVFDSNTLEEGALALVDVRPRVLAIAGTHRNNSLNETTCDGSFSGGAKFRQSDVAHHPDNFFHATHLWLEANLANIRTIQFHGFCCPGAPPYDDLSDDCVVANGFNAVPGPADFTQILHDRIEAQNFLADGADLTTVAVFGQDTNHLGATTNLQGRISNGVTEGDECDTPAGSASGRFIHLEQDPDVREEPQHILDALNEALDEASDLPSPCAMAPEMGCRLAAPGKSQLSIDDKEGTEKDRMKWKWGKGELTELSAFSDAVGGSAIYQVCTYDASVAPQPLVDAGVGSGGTCSDKPCWKAKGTKGYSFKDKLAAGDGLSAVKLGAGEEDKAKVQAKIAGVNFAVPELPLTTPVTVQLLVDDGNTIECWQSTFTDSPKKNSNTQFKAKQ